VQIQSILNRVEKYSSFVYRDVRLLEEGGHLRLEVDIHARRNSRPVCSECGRKGSQYDSLPSRCYEFVPLWSIPVFFCYARRRVNCCRCGRVVAEQVPWAEGKHHQTKSYSWFLARWAKRMNWAEVARCFKTSWDSVFRAVEYAVEWGRSHANYEGIRAIGIDEIQWRRGHQYLTLVYQIDTFRRRLIWIGEHRRVKTLLRFFKWFGKERSQELKYLCSDMWKPYLKVIARKASQAIHVLDRFHIVAKMNKAIDEVRAKEVKQLQQQGREPVLTRARWCVLKHRENLTSKQETKLADLLKYNLRTVRSYLLREEFRLFWTYISPYWAGKFLDRWCTKVMRSRIEPMKKVVRTLRTHRDLILNYFRARKEISSAVVEGFNNKAKLTTRRSRGFRSLRKAQIALYHTLGDLPEPEMTHEFC
jgi:transposase